MFLPNKLLGGDESAMGNKRSIQVKKVGEWNRLLNANPVKVFQHLTQAAVSLLGITTEPVTAVAGGVQNLVDAGAAIVGKENDSLEHRAYLLIYNALRQTLVQLVERAESTLKKVQSEGETWKYDAAIMQELIDRLDEAFENQDLSIDVRFLEQPEGLKLLEDIFPLFIEWLKGLGVDEIDAGHIANPMKWVFVSELNKVWDTKKDYFSKLRAGLEEAFSTERAWRKLQYNNYLVLQWKERVFDSVLGLDQLYIPLRACYALNKRGKDERGKRKMQVVDSERFVWGWLQDTQEGKEVMVLRGGPGSGKSSLMKRLAMRVATESQRPVYFIPLNRFRFKEGFNEDILYFIKYQTLLTSDDNPFEGSISGEGSRPVFIFDGLDELSMSGDSGRSDATEFVRQLESFIDHPHLSIKVILTGRDLVIQLAETLLLNNHYQVLELLPYIVNVGDREWESYDFQDGRRLLPENQSDRWWANYQEKVGMSGAGVPKVLAGDPFLPLRSQPLLNYLLAITYREGLIQPEIAENFNLLYETLLRSAHERQWKGKRGFKHAGRLSEEDYFKVLEEVAVSTWLPQEEVRSTDNQSDGIPISYMRWTGGIRTTSLNKIQDHCKQMGLEDLVSKLDGLAKSPYHRLIIATFMRGVEIEEGKDYMVEFTHKSFAEYLLARKIVGLVNEIYRDYGLLETPEAIHKAIGVWKKLGGQEDFSRNIFAFLCREIQLRWRENPQEAAARQSCLAKLYSEVLKWGFELDVSNSKDAISQVRKFETNLLLTLSALAKVSRQKTRIEWLKGDYPRKAISRLRIEHYPNSAWALSHLEFPAGREMGGINLMGADLQGIHLEGANLGKANFQLANLIGAILSGAILSGAILSGAILNGADLEGADLSGADLSRADLSEADLSGAILSGAILSGADLQKARLSNRTRLPRNWLGQYEIQTAIYEGGKISGQALKELLKRLSR